MTVQQSQSAVIFLISIEIDTPKRSLTMLKISFIGCHPFTMSGQMIGSAEIKINSQCGSGKVQKIGFARVIQRFQRSFRWTQRMMIISSPEVLPYHMMNLVLILLYGAHIQNQMDMKLPLLCLILYQIFLHRELHLQILIQQEILLKSDMLFQDNAGPISGSNGPKPYETAEAIINSSECS